MKKDTKIKTNSQKGFTLVEVVAALGISALVITALISLSISTLRISLDSKLLLEGTKIASRQIELVRAYRDGEVSSGIPRGWRDFIDNLRDCSVFNNPLFSCHMEDDGSLRGGVGYKGTGAEQIAYQFKMTDVQGVPLRPTDYPDIVRISVSVTWKVGDEQKGSYIYTDLSNWRMK